MQIHADSKDKVALDSRIWSGWHHTIIMLPLRRGH